MQKKVLSNDQLEVLRTLSRPDADGSALLNDAAILGAHGFAESDGLGGVRITAEGRKYLRDADAGQLL